MGIWLIDSGASRHFTGYKEVLHNLVEKETNLEIILGDDMKYLVKGVGNVSLKLNQGNTIHLQDVLYVPDLKKNLVSISEMEDKGYKIPSAMVDGRPLGVMSCDTMLQPKLWHRRFSHLHYKALPDIKQMVTGIPKFRVEKEGVCPRCAEGKLKRGPFPSSQSKTSDILQLVHSGIPKVGIKRETTTPHTPEQNGVAERKNCTIVEAVWAMLHDQRLPKFLWAETTNVVVYAQNQRPHQALGSKSPEENFIGIDYDVIFTPVSRYTTIYSIIALAASQGWNLHQMDVKTTFVHSSIKEEVYVEQPEGFDIYD
eukprot:PITA_07998